MIGSSYPDVLDSLAISQGTPWSASLLRDLAAMLLATQRTIGARPGNLGELGISGYTDWKEAFFRRAAIELGSWTTTVGSGSSESVSFAQPLRFNSAPRVFITPFSTGAGSVANVGTRVTSITTSGFTAYPVTSGLRIFYLAIPPEWDD